MNIRKSETMDFEAICHVYKCAREYMKNSGNPTQWGDKYPNETLITEDIESGRSYVLTDADGKVRGTFVFAIGIDPTYNVIENGTWLNDKPYGFIHRVANDGSIKGMFAETLAFCLKEIDNIRIDTHNDNKTMQHVLQKNGFALCGIIHIADGSERIAYQFEKN